MSRSGYGEDGPDSQEEQWAMICYQGQLASAMRGRRGQAFLAELVEALDAMPNKRLIAEDLRKGGDVCAIGSVGAKRGVDLEALDPDDPDTIAGTFGIAPQLVSEIEWQNDDAGPNGETPEQRWQRIRAWAVRRLKPTTPGSAER